MKNQSILQAFLLIAMAGVAGCAHSPSPRSEVFATRQFTAPVGQPLEVNTGDEFYVAGTFIDGERIDIPSTLDMMIPGSMFIPFPIRIDAGRLEMSATDESWKYYCAEEGKASASFPGLGSVIRRGDCVGIRVSTDGKKKEWVVDNSNYNRMETIWSKSMSREDFEKYVPKPSAKPYKVQSIKRITFDGYYGGQLHFTWQEVQGNNKDSRSFVFDFQGQPKVVGIKGNQLKVLSADDVKARYEWIKFD